MVPSQLQPKDAKTFFRLLLKTVFSSFLKKKKTEESVTTSWLQLLNKIFWKKLFLLTV
jgi:hypothetical protein